MYELEKGKIRKYAYKLNEQVLAPKSIEKTNVGLADRAHHESTINGLRYYASKGYSHFEDTATYIQYVRDWFNSVNVKSKDYGHRKRDERRRAIHRETMYDDLSYISDFAGWLKRWQSLEQNQGLTKQTFECAIRSCECITALIPYLFELYPDLDFILLGNISSDFLEGRFGWWRQLCGGNYYNAVVQFLQAEKTIRLRSLVNMGYDMNEIKSIFSDVKASKSLIQKEDIESFVNELAGFQFTDDSQLSHADKNLIYYLAGYIAHSLAKQECDDCNNILTPGKVPLPVSFEDVEGEVEESDLRAKEEFINAISRGGLTKPSDYLYIASVHASSLCNYIFKNENLKKTLFGTENSRDTFVGCFLRLLKNDENCEYMINVKCDKGHSHTQFINRVAFTIFNISAKNYVSEMNDLIRTKPQKATTSKPNTAKRSEAARKIKKLQSQ